MFCKFCGAQLEENTTICASCGQDNAEKPAKKSNTLKIVLAVVAGIVLLAMLGTMVYYGLYGTLKPRANDVLYKDNYTVADDSLKNELSKVIASVGDDELTNEQLQIFYWMQIYNYGYYYGCDFSKPLNEQVMENNDGKTWQQYFLETALKNWNQYQVLAQMAQKDGFKIPEEYQKVLDGLPETTEKNAKDGGFASAAEMLEKDFGKGVTFESYQKFFDLFYISNLYFGDLLDKQEVTDAEIEAYYEKNKDSLKTDWGTKITKESGKLVDVRHVLIQPEKTKDESGKEVITDAAWEACREKAQKLYDEWQKGTRDEITFGDLAYKNSADGNKDEGGLYTNISKGVMVKEFEDWCFDESRKHGDHGLVKTQYGYHIMFFVGAEEGWVRLSRDGALDDMADALLADILKENAADINYKAVVLGNVNLSGS